MRRVAAGDEAAFGLLARRHHGRIRRLALKMLRVPAEADDIAQETLVRLWRNAGRWRPEKSRLTTWIYTIVYRLCIDRLRVPRNLPLDEAMDAEEPAPGGLETLIHTEERRQLDKAMQLLQPRQRAALLLFYYEELTGHEAAEALGVSLRAFWSLLHRARESVEQTIRQETHFPAQNIKAKPL